MSQVVVSSGGGVDGYDPASGEKLWTLEDIGGNTGCTPIDCGDGRFLIGASPGRNGENAGSAARSNCMVQVTRDGDQFVAEKRWVADGAFPSWASPILHEGLAYWINRSGVVFCFDARTGQQVFAERTPQSCWATPFAIGQRIYLFGKDGLVTVLKAGREFEVIAENVTWNPEDLPEKSPLPEETSEERRRASAMFSKPTLYGYAATSDAFYVRVGNALICCRQSE
jgi:outer membrane protein assembly factor BamB